jgi:hypothetical protein
LARVERDDERRLITGEVERGIHPGNTSEQNPFCGIAIAPESFVCNPLE